MTIYYTGRGDKGKTSLFKGLVVSKTDKRLHALGSLDELNAVIGIVISFSTNKARLHILNQIQNDLFLAQEELRKGRTKIVSKIEEQNVIMLEKIINRIILPKQQVDQLPGGRQVAAFLYLAKSVCRRAERDIVAARSYPLLVKYVNRLSSLFHVYAIQANNKKEFI